MSASSAAYSVACPQRHLVEGDLLRAGAAERLEADALMLELRLGELVEAVAEAAARIEVEAHQHRVVVGRDVDACLGEHHPVVLEVMPDLEDRRVLQQRLQPRRAPAAAAAGSALREKRSPPPWPTGM